MQTHMHMSMKVLTNVSEPFDEHYEHHRLVRCCEGQCLDLEEHDEDMMTRNVYTKH